MPIQAITRHDTDFEIHTHPVDPAKSPYARFPGYRQKVAAFYKEIDIKSAIWAFPGDQPPKYVERCKPCEYVLQLDVSRVAAYVNESTWSPYVMGDREDFEYSTLPIQYPLMSLIIPTPITEAERHLFRRYRNTNGPDHFEIVEEWSFANGDNAT